MKIYKVWHWGMVSKIFFTYEDALQWIYDKMEHYRLKEDGTWESYSRELYYMRITKNKTQFVRKDFGCVSYSIIEVEN